jgi:alcohol dehydrogenase (cytochrome c)
MLHHARGYGSSSNWVEVRFGGRTSGPIRTSMPVAIADAPVRSAIIAYLRSVHTPMSPSAAAAPSEAAAASKPVPSGGPTQDELTRAAASTSDWLYASKDYTGQRFVKLSQINRKNAHDLRPICIIRADSATPTQTNPLIYKGVMYATVDTSVVAIDATTCRLRWSYKWDAKGRRVLSPANRGVAIKDGIVVRGTADGYLIALDMQKGQLIWSREIGGAEKSQYMSMPPLIFEDMVIYGPAGADWGAKNWVGAFVDHGRTHVAIQLIPDDGEPGADSWKDPKARIHGGASLWTPLALDANRGILYLPVGNPAPDFYGSVREGDNLYTNSAVALDVRTGKLLWYRQFVANDVHDADLEPGEPDLLGNGRRQGAEPHHGQRRDGLLTCWIATRETLHTLPITTRKNVDSPPTVAGVHRCPGLLGGMEWNGPAYDPLSKTLYVAAVDWCGTFKRSADPPEFTAFAHHYGGSVVPDPREQSSGWLTAIDSTTGKVRWKKHWPTPLVAAVTTTSGGVLFTGDLDNNFLVLDASNGNTLYKFNTGGSVGGGVVTYEIGGKQYVATTSGVISGFFGGSGTSAMIVFALR